MTVLNNKICIHCCKTINIKDVKTPCYRQGSIDLYGEIDYIVAPNHVFVQKGSSSEEVRRIYAKTTIIGQK